MAVSVVIPWRADPERAPLLKWLVRRLADFYAINRGWALSIATLPEDHPWSKPAAIRAGLQKVTGDVVICHDADVWTPGLDAAIAEVCAGAPWAVPHARVHRLAPDSTTAILAGAEPTERMGCLRRPYRGTAAGGVVVLRTDLAREIPPDPRFTGWGGEDVAWRDALRCLAGMEWRGHAPLYHLFHEPADRDGRRHGSEGNRTLVARYAAARRDPWTMHALVREAQAVAA